MALTLAAVSANAAISFSNINTPGGVTANVSGGSITFTASDFFFSTGAGLKTFGVSYTVTSSLGALTTAEISNPGLLKKAWFKAEIDHDGDLADHTWSAAGSSAANLSPSLFVALDDQSSYNVELTISAQANAGGYVNAKNTNVAYNEAVPEPASMAALALGFGLIAKRRNRK
ncbi:MAG: PEP-CTERM sorting domain-containing protein [Fimbriimonas sp.]